VIKIYLPRNRGALTEIRPELESVRILQNVGRSFATKIDLEVSELDVILQPDAGQPLEMNVPTTQSAFYRLLFNGKQCFTVQRHALHQTS
jgi:hypothetical protein